MRLLLGSGGFRTEDRRASLVEAMRRHFGGASRLLFVPYALADHDGYVRSMTEWNLDAGYELTGIHTARDPVAAVREAEGIYVGGGNSFRLIDDLQRLGLLDPIRERVREGIPYMGVSAGTNAACPTMMTTNDMPIVHPVSFEALGLVPFQINAHYFAGQTHVETADGYTEHFGETRDDRIREYHEMNTTPVLGLWEGAWLEVDGSSMRLDGGPARLFRRGRDPEDVAVGARLTTSL